MKIEEIIKDYCISIGDYKLNPDGSITVNGNVDFSKSSRLVSELPLSFYKVSGNFDCSNQSLTTLKGCPREVGGTFDCSYNQLISLEFSPKKVGGVFIFDNSVKDVSMVISSFGEVMLLRRIDDQMSPLPSIIRNNARFLDYIFEYQQYYEIWDNDGNLNNEDWMCLIADIKDGFLKKHII